MKTVEELQLELLEEKEKVKTLETLVEDKNARIVSLEKTNTQLYDKVTSTYNNENENGNEDDEPVESFDDFINKIGGSK